MPFKTPEQIREKNRKYYEKNKQKFKEYYEESKEKESKEDQFSIIYSVTINNDVKTIRNTYDIHHKHKRTWGEVAITPLLVFNTKLSEQLLKAFEYAIVIYYGNCTNNVGALMVNKEEVEEAITHLSKEHKKFIINCYEKIGIKFEDEPEKLTEPSGVEGA